MDRFLGNMLKEFGNIYSLQDSGKSFESVPEMLSAMGGEKFVKYTQLTAKEALKDIGVSEKIIDELATAVTRCNYGQDMSVNAFTGNQFNSICLQLWFSLRNLNWKRDFHIGFLWCFVSNAIWKI